MSEPITTIGKLLTGDEQRDAVHVAIAPVVAAAKLRPGEHVGLNDSGEADWRAEQIGIVDPFLTADVQRGERCWLFLYPNTIKSLRHEWFHPAFVPAATTISDADHAAKSREWIKQHAAVLGLTDDVLMADAEHWLAYEEHQVQHNSERWRDYFQPEEFWHHYEIVTGKPVPSEKKRSFYCCTC